MSTTVVREFLDLLARTRPRIGVVGDSMVDRYVPVVVDRVSPEFPNPITRRDRSRPIVELPGGAANVANQFRHFPVDHRLVTYYDDAALLVFRAAGLRFEELSLGRGGTGFNPVKTRYYVDDFPYSRHDDEMDFEDWSSGLADHVAGLDGWDDFDALIVSDYHKGFFHPSNRPEVWARRGRVVVDPKKDPIARWRGCTVFKPNAAEARVLSGKVAWGEQADFFLRSLSCEHVVITQGGDGVVGKSRDGGRFEYRPARGIPPRSVIGAGDCFVAFLAMALALGFSIDRCAEVAFTAGAAYVRDIHNKPITPHQLLHQEDPYGAKYLVPYRPREFRLAFSNGCFDILHAGHLETLRFARAQGDRLLVALNSDASIARLKGPGRPIVPLEQRMALVAALGCVDFVCAFEADTPADLIEAIDPDVVVKGGDYGGREVVGSGRPTRLAPLVPGLSTTALVQRSRSLT